MGLFSSKSSSTSTTYNQSAQSSGTIGDLSNDNQISSGDIINEGLTGDNLKNILDSNESVLSKGLEFLEATIASNQKLADKTISSSQTSAANAIEATGAAYADAYSGSTAESSRFFDALRPFAVIAGIVAIFYFWGKK